MKNINRLMFILLAFIPFATLAENVVEIDGKEYFAYANATELGFVATISHTPCNGTKKAWGNGWEKAEFNYFERMIRVPACWKNSEEMKGVIDLCYLSTTDKGKGDCIPASKSKFIDTKTIPSGVKF